MAFVTGLYLIDAPASALNNLGTIEGERYDNSTGVKVIRSGSDFYPYVSAQAFRYWLRQTLARIAPQWKAAPVYREEKIAYTDANPIEYWDDDLFGYMRAPSTKESAKAKREADETRKNETPTKDTITRVAPFRVSTLVSIAPTRPTSDFGVMARQEGNPVLHEHQFYRTTMQGLFSLSLSDAGTFSYKQRTGYRHLDEERVGIAKARGLEHMEEAKAYRLPQTQRSARVRALFEGLAHLEGGAKQTLHYTDVSPAVAVMAVTKGGNHIFGHIIGASKDGKPMLKTDALREALRVFADDLLSPVFIGWTTGYADDERAKAQQMASEDERIKLSHPREAFLAMADTLDANPGWLE
jgi:CRISPR-associated protein Cst2